MDAAVVVDASVWVSGFISKDINHNASRLWIERYIAGGGLQIAPAFLLIEVAAAVSRQAGHPTLGREAIRTLYYVRSMRFMSLDSAFIWTAVEVAADLQLRAGDATYLAVARQLNIPLVSWDREQLQKAGNLATTYTPRDYAF